MPIKFILGAVASLSLLSVGSTAFASGCGVSGETNCSVGVNYIPSSAPQFGPMTVTDNHPMGHLRTVDFQRAPHVSIMRVHGMGPTADLSDAPVGFTQGCHPQSTQYCRGGGVQSAPIAPQRIIAQPVTVPRPAPVIRTGQGYDPSKFAPRQYGENIFTPGIAHIPTSIVDRSPENADRALNSGRTVPQPIANGGVAPRPSMMQQPSVAYAPSVRIPTNYFQAPMRTTPVPQGNIIGYSRQNVSGNYWERVSGPKFMGNTLATEIVCRRQSQAQIVRPVIGVPVPVPTPGVGRCAAPQNLVGSSRYEQAPPGWTF